MKNLIQFLIILYKKIISPVIPQCCRFYPTCSDYMLESLDKHGLCRGVVMGLLRIMRCNPFFKGGHDPVK